MGKRKGTCDKKGKFWMRGEIRKIIVNRVANPNFCPLQIQHYESEGTILSTVFTTDNNLRQPIEILFYKKS
jgi:hypothetical protein